MLIGIAELLIGYWILTRFRRRRYRAMAQALEVKRRSLDMRESLIRIQEQTVQRIAAIDPLTRMTLESALAREERAKAALRSLLTKYGCDQAQIDDVLASVDGSEEGDL